MSKFHWSGSRQKAKERHHKWDNAAQYRVTVILKKKPSPRRLSLEVVKARLLARRK